MKICILEDDPAFAFLVGRSIEGLAEVVTNAATWEAAEEFLKEADLAWIDLRLYPGCGEEEAMHKLSELRKRNKRMIIIVGSGYITERLKAALTRSGVDDFFYKDTSFKPEQVAALIMKTVMRCTDRDPATMKAIQERGLEWIRQKFPSVNLAA